MTYPAVKLRKNKYSRVITGHPWIFDNEIEIEPNDLKAGEVVDIIDFKKDFIGRGFYNPNSKIRVRIISNNALSEINASFIYDKIKFAKLYREKLGFTDSFRAIFAEADFLSGLIVDKFEDSLSLQIMSLGLELYKNEIIEALKAIYQPKCIMERNDLQIREVEGLKQIKKLAYGKIPANLIINEGKVKFGVDIENGQKTGHFLDQVYNHQAIRNIVQNASVVDFFCHTGGFGIHAARYGAKSVYSVDISELAISKAKENAKLNNIANIDFKVANVFDHLKELIGGAKKFDVVILDPPAFTKSKQTLGNAKRGYKEINLRGMKILNSGGFLVTCTCSHHMSYQEFSETIESAARDCGKTLRLVESRFQSSDHPIVPSIAETFYLKCLIYQVI